MKTQKVIESRAVGICSFAAQLFFISSLNCTMAYIWASSKAKGKHIVPTLRLCGLCAHYRKEEGMFGYCMDGRRKEYDDTTFSTNTCDWFTHKAEGETNTATPILADFGSKLPVTNQRDVAQQMVRSLFMGWGLPPGMPTQTECPPGCSCQKEPEPKTERVNPCFRRVKKKGHAPRKVINLAEVIAEREKADATKG